MGGTCDKDRHGPCTTGACILEKDYIKLEGFLA